MSDHTPEGGRRKSRRQFIGAVIGGATVGAAWTTSLAVLARGRHPQIFVLGDGDWQILLIEHQAARILLLSGEFDQTLDRKVDHILGVLRQHVDVVVGTHASLDRLADDFVRRRSVSTIIALDGSDSTGRSSSFIPLTDSLLLSAGAFGLTLRRLPFAQWVESSTVVSSWTCHIAIDSLKIAIGPTLEVLGMHGHPQTALAIAPSGDLGAITMLLPAAAIATNPGSVTLDQIGDNPDTNRRSIWLTRTFSSEIAGFIVRGERIQLPAWSDTIQFSNDIA